MFRFLTQTTRLRPTATALALVALLAVLSGQALELVHQHELGDVTENCLLCKAESGSVVAVTQATVQARPLPDRISEYTCIIPSSAPRAANLARGPPHIS